MQKDWIRTSAGYTAMKMLSAAAVCFAMLCVATSARAAVVFALTDNNRLLQFNSSAPGTLLGVAPISGRVDNEDLIGIDFRPSNLQLYAIGEFGNIYTINTSTAVATPVGTLAADPSDPTSPFSGLAGSRFGFDFNPVADRLRVTSDTRQSLRINVDTGLVFTDGNLAYGAGDPNAGQNPNVTGVAYTNSLPGAGSTTLYGIDATAGQHRLVTIVPPNDGTLNTVGGLGLDVSSLMGFDILSAAPQETAYAAMQNEALGISQFFEVNLATGQATLIGTIGGGDLIDGLTVVIPEPGMLSLLGLGALALLRRR